METEEKKGEMKMCSFVFLTQSFNNMLFDRVNLSPQFMSTAAAAGMLDSKLEADTCACRVVLLGLKWNWTEKAAFIFLIDLAFQQ